MPRAGQPQIQVIAGWRGVQIFTEQTFKLTGRQVRHARNIGLGQRFFQIVFHRLDHRQQLGVADTKARAKLHALAVGGLADAVMNELVGYLGCKV